jgi:hypothetical protein
MVFFASSTSSRSDGIGTSAVGISKTIPCHGNQQRLDGLPNDENDDIGWLTQSNHRQSIWVEQLELFITPFRHGLRKRKKQSRYRLVEPRIDYKKDAVDANKPESCQQESATVYLFVRVIFEGVHVINPVSILR